VRRGRLGPGQMLSVDPEGGGFLTDAAIKSRLAARAPYSRWTYEGLRRFPIGTPLSELGDEDEITCTQVAFGVNKEEVAMVLKPMATDAKEPTFSMGDDTPFAAVAKRPRLVHHFLRQRFAQVTNPPIDHLRERMVMSLRTCLGPRQPLLSERPAAARLLELPTFFLYPDAVEHLLDPERAPFPAVRLDATFPVADGPAALATTIARLADEAEAAVRGGAAVVVVANTGIGPDRAPVPGLLATGAVHERILPLLEDLRRSHGKRTRRGSGRFRFSAQHFDVRPEGFNGAAHSSDQSPTPDTGNDGSRLGGEATAGLTGLAPLQFFGKQFCKLLGGRSTSMFDVNHVWRKATQLIPRNHIRRGPGDDFLRGKP